LGRRFESCPAHADVYSDRPEHALGLGQAAHLIGDDQIVVLPRPSQAQPHHRLALAVVAQGGDRLGREVNRPAGACGLRLTETQLAVASI
jgi:hypothetical protein